MTKEQAVNTRYGEELHCTIRHDCAITIGKRGRYSDNIVKCRVSGKCKTWKRDPERFYLPVKHGLYESGAVEDYNKDSFHLASECPAVLAYKTARENGALENGKTYR